MEKQFKLRTCRNMECAVLTDRDVLTICREYRVCLQKPCAAIHKKHLMSACTVY